jgi:hypothetical protein
MCPEGAAKEKMQVMQTGLRHKAQCSMLRIFYAGRIAVRCCYPNRHTRQQINTQPLVVRRPMRADPKTAPSENQSCFHNTPV